MSRHKIIASARKRVSPLYKAYKERVEADGGIVARTQEEMQAYYPALAKASWMHIASGYKAGKAHTIQPNTIPGDILFSRNSKTTRYNRAGKLVECLSHEPVIEYNPFTGAFEGYKFSPQATNRVPNSQNNTYAANQNVTIEAYDWGFTTLYTHAVKVGDNSIIRRVQKTNTNTSNMGGVIYSFFIKMDDGSEPRIGSDTDPYSDFSVWIGGAYFQQDVSNNSKIWKRRITDTVWYISCYSNYGGASTVNTIIKGTGNSNKGFRVVGNMIELGATAGIPGAHIVTTGTAATKLYDDATTALVLPMDSILFADMVNKYESGSTTVPRGFSLRIDASNHITVGFTMSGFIGMAIIQGGNVILQITTTVKAGKICARFTSGQYVLVVNGVEYSGFTVGNQSVVNPFTNSTDITLGNSQRDIGIRAVAVLNNLSIDEMKSLTV